MNTNEQKKRLALTHREHILICIFFYVCVVRNLMNSGAHKHAKTDDEHSYGEHPKPHDPHLAYITCTPHRQSHTANAGRVHVCKYTRSIKHPTRYTGMTMTKATMAAAATYLTHSRNSAGSSIALYNTEHEHHVCSGRVCGVDCGVVSREASEHTNAAVAVAEVVNRIFCVRSGEVVLFFRCSVRTDV